MSRKIVGIYCWVMLMYGLSVSFFFATYVIFLTNAGLGLLEVNVINVVFMISSFFLEVPTGVVADVYGRKTSLVASCFVTSLAFLLYFFSDTFLLFVIAEVIAAIGHALCSGAFKAWMIDEVNATGESFDLTRAYRSGKISNSLGIIVGVILGGYLGEYNIALPWLFASASIFVTGIVSIFIIKENGHTPVVHERGAMAAMIDTGRLGFQICTKSPGVLFAMSLGFVFSFACMPLNMYWQLRYQGFGLKVSDLGYLFSANMLVLMLGVFVSVYVYRALKTNKRSLFFTISVMAIGILMAAVTDTLVFSLSMFYIHELARGIYEPLVDDYVNKRIDEQTRATVLSFKSMTSLLGASLGLLVSGLIAKYFGIEAAWICSAIVVLVFVVVFVFRENSKQKEIVHERC